MKKMIVGLLTMSVACLCGCGNPFDNVAKDKASEVGPAFGTYVHMQDANVIDRGEAGSFADIGFEPFNSSYFVYSDLGSGMVATSKVDLGKKCPAGSKWMIKVSVKDNEAIYSTSISSEGCASLTPNFDKIGQPH